MSEEILTFQTHDEYDWLRDKNWPEISNEEILNHIRTENAITQEFFISKEIEIQKIFQEIKSRIAIQDFTVPYKHGDYLYYSYILDGQSYWNHARIPVQDDINHDILEVCNQNFIGNTFLNENELAKNSEFFSLYTYSISPCQKFVAYSVNYNGNERYDIIVQNIETGEIIDNSVVNTMGSIIWHNTGFFFIPANELWRAEKVIFHNLNGENIEIFHEKDYTFSVSIFKSTSERFLFISSESANENEILYIDLQTDVIKSKNLKYLFKRSEGIIYRVSHHDNHFYVLTNDRGNNFRLIKIALNNIEDFEELIAHNTDIPLTDLYTYAHHIVISSQSNGLPTFTIYSITDEGIKLQDKIAFEEPSYDANIQFTTFDASCLRYQYSSLKTPQKVFEYDFNTQQTSNLKTVTFQHFNPNDYEVFYEFVSVPPVYFSESTSNTDNVYLQKNVLVPISIIRKKNTTTPQPTLLYGYGSYGLSVPSYFRPDIFSLIDRGFSFAIAHIRGGGEFGKMWHQAGKLEYKKNTFQDFIKAAEYLIERQYSSSISISGGSAGGMLMGYCINYKPNLFHSAIMYVPFVDVLNTMLDDSLPLTPGEFKEWGNPIIDKKAFEYIKSYSPYDNITPQNYPNILISSGLYDQRVTYWEPLKFITKLRKCRTNDSMLFLNMKMDSGHFGASDRFNYLYERAQDLVFLLTTYRKI